MEVLTETVISTCACVFLTFKKKKKKVFQDLEGHIIEWQEALCEEGAFYLNSLCFHPRSRRDGAITSEQIPVYSVWASRPFLQQFIDLTSPLTSALLCSHLNPKRMTVTETGISHYYILLLHTRQNHFNYLQLNDWWGKKMLQMVRNTTVSPRNCCWL